jgi:cholesterol transport system auxiliary component
MKARCAKRGVGRVSLIVLCISICIAGCAGSLFQSKAVPPSTYLLSADLRTAPAVVAPAVVAADLAVQRPRVRTGLESDRIAVLYPDRRLDYFADARWSGPLDQVVRDLAVQAFVTGAHLRNVSAESSAFPSGYWLEILVADFQAEYTSAGPAPTVHVHLVARLGSARDRRVLGTFDASSRQTASDNRLTAIVDAYERAADAALAEIVANTSRTLSDSSEHP